MNLRHLRVFQTVCEENSVTKAAQRLYMTQPAVSHVLHDLEEQLGYPLFDRISRRLYLTSAGEQFLAKVTQVLFSYDELEQEAKEYEKKASIRIGSCITIANYWLPEILGRFQEVSDTSVQVQVDIASRIMEKLERNEIDLAFVEGTQPPGDYRIHAFSSYQIRLVYASSYPIQEIRELKDLQKERLLLREKGSAIRDTFDSRLLLSGLQVEPSWTSVNSQALLQAAKAALGIAVLPDRLVRQALKEGTLKEVQLPGISLTNTNYVLYHREKFISAPMELLLSMAKELFS